MYMKTVINKPRMKSVKFTEFCPFWQNSGTVWALFLSSSMKRSASYTSTMSCDSTQCLSARRTPPSSPQSCLRRRSGFSSASRPRTALWNITPQTASARPQAACLSQISQAPTLWLQIQTRRRTITQTRVSWMTWSISGNLLSRLSADTW